MVVLVQDPVVEVVDPVAVQAVAVVPLQMEYRHQSNHESQGSHLNYSLHNPLTTGLTISRAKVSRSSGLQRRTTTANPPKFLTVTRTD